jgi:PAS domain S-box-containing protein
MAQQTKVGMASGKLNQKSRRTSVRDTKTASGFSKEVIEDRLFLLASIVEYSDDAIITQTSKGVITSWNSGAERIYGYSAKEVVGQPISILIPPGQSDEVPALLERIERGERIGHYQTVRRRKDGQLVHVSQSIAPIKDKNGRLIGVSTIARDITANVAAPRESEEKLAAASQYARSLLESSLDPLVTISGRGKITDVNEATIKVTGVHRDQLIGTDFSNYFTEPEKAREGYQQVFANGFVTDYPLTIRHKDGRLTDVLYNASVYKDARGRVIGVFAAARDVTARKRIEEELAEQRRKELDRLAELEKFQRLTVGRELKMVELKKEIEELRKENETLKKRLGQDTR